MAEEEQEWRSTQLGTGLGDEGQDGDEHMDVDKAETGVDARDDLDGRNTQPNSPIIRGDLIAEDQDGDDHMDEDWEGADLRSDITPGCHVLDINIDGIEYPRIWVRAEYLRIYDFLEDCYNDAVEKPGRAPGAVLTGQPGIGEFSQHFM
jgi:hypothetical protein